MESYRKVSPGLTSPVLALREECTGEKARITEQHAPPATAFCPQAYLVSFSIPCRQLSQGLKSLGGLQDWRWIWQPTLQMEVRVLTAQFLARKNVSYISVQRSTLSF